MGEREYLVSLEQKIQIQPGLIKQYIQNNSPDQRQLTRISRAIVNVYKTEGPTNDRHSLDQCHDMALSAGKSMVQKLYHSIIPEMLECKKQNSLLYGYLKVWTGMFPGKFQYIIFPNFEKQYGSLVSQTSIPTHLKSTLSQFQNNIKASNSAVQFFEDSLFSEYDTHRQEIDIKPPPQFISTHLLQNIKLNLLSSNNPLLLSQINKLYQFRHQYSIPNSLDTTSQQYFNNNRQWINRYLTKYQQVRNQPNWNSIISAYFKQLQSQGQINQKPDPFNFDSMKINSERAINPPNKQQDFKQFKKAVNTFSPDPSQFQLYMSQTNIKSKEAPIVVKKHVPNFLHSPIKTNKEGDLSSLLIQPLEKYFSQTKDLQKSAFSKTMKLSQFSNQKDIRKKRMSEEQLDSAPQWLIIPYLSFFNDYRLYSRYRKNSMLMYSTILQDQRIIVNCIKKRVSSVALQFIINYQNYSSSPINLKACYKIAHQTFQVKSNKKIKSNFILHKKQSHQFTLVIKQLPLRICALELSYNNNSFDIPLPFTIINFVRSEPVSKQQFFTQWNHSNSRTNYSLSTKLFYNRNILLSEQIHELFENCVDLGRTENYSSEQYGLKLSFEYYNLQFLLIFAFNIDTYLSLEMISCREIDEERVEVLNYYMKVLIMLLENMKE